MPLDTTGLRPLDTSGLRPLGSGGEAGGRGFDTSGLTRLDTSGLTPMEPEGPGAISRGFVSGLLQQNPELASEAMEGLSHLAPEQLRGAFGDASRSLREWSQMSPEEYAPRARSLWESESLGEALTWAGEAFGQGIASTVPSIITGTAGAVTGGRVGGRAGGLVGGAAGAAVPSAALNYGEVYRALKEEGVDPERAAEVGAYAAVPMVALDTLSIGPIITRLGGIDKVRQEASRRIARRIAQEAARGAGREGITEAAQDVVKEIAVSIETDQPFWTVENLGEFVESGIAGAMVGGTLGGAAGIRPDQQAATQAPPTFQPGDRVQWIGDEGKSFAGTVTAVGRGGNVYQVQRDDGNTAMVGSSYLSAAGAPVEITPDDAASPLPTDAIRQGKEIIQDALEGRQRPEAPVEAPVDLPQGAVPADVLLGAEVEQQTPSVDSSAPISDPVAEPGAQPFQVTAEWQPVPEGAVLPGGVQVTMDMETGQQMARQAPEAAPQTAPEAVQPAPEAIQAPEQQPQQDVAPTFDPNQYLPEARRYVTEGSGRLTPEALGRHLGIEPQQAQQVLATLTTTPDSGILVGRDGRLRRAPRQTAPMDVLGFLASRGGIRDDEGHDLRRSRDLQRLVPGHGPLIRPNGLHIDDAGEALWEAGYFGDPETTPRPGEREVLDLIEEASRRRIYTPEQQEVMDARQREARQADQEESIRQEIRNLGRELGEPFAESDIRSIMDIIAEDGLETEAAVDFYVERLALQAVDQASREDQEAAYDIPFDPVEDEQASSAPGVGARDSQPAREPGDTTEGAESRPPAAEIGRPQEQVAPPPVTEQTDQGEQVVIPGAEQRPQSEAAQQQAEGLGPVLTIADHSEKSIIITGQTRENIDRIKAAVPGVRPLWNRRAKGWIFPKKRESQVREALADLLGDAPQEPAASADAFPEQAAPEGYPEGYPVGDEIAAGGPTPALRNWIMRAPDADLQQALDQVGSDGLVSRAIQREQENRQRRLQETEAQTADGFRGQLEATGEATDAGGTIFQIRRSRDGRTWGVQTRREGEATATFRGPGGPGEVWSRDEAIRRAVRDAILPRPAERPATYGASNTLVTRERAEELRRRLREKLRGQLSSGVDPELIALGTELAVFHLEAGARSFADYSRAMVADLGEAARPYLRSWYEGARHFPGLDTTGMTPAAEIEDTPADTATPAASPATVRPDAPQESDDGVQGTVPPGDARAGAADVQPAAPDRGAGRPSEPEGGRGAADVRGADGGRPEAAQRPAGTAVPQTGGGSRPGDPDRVPAGGRSGTRGSAGEAARVKGENFTIEPGALQEGRGRVQKARDNIRAIELMREIEAEGRPATRAEQEQLALYVGWGGLKGAFPDAQGRFEKGLEQVGERLRELMSETEYATARRSMQYAHYTSEAIVSFMWEAARRMGFAGGKVFEPGMGIGNFAGLMPADIATRSDYNGIELDHTTARIARLLYPRYGVRQDDFTRAPLPKDTFDLVIGNPPFADVAVRSDPNYPQGFLLHDYFFAKSLDAVRPGGLLAFISSAGTMNKLDDGARKYLAERADLAGAIRLPGNAFEKNAGTSVTTDIIFLRKKDPNAIFDRAVPAEVWTETTEMTLPDKDGNPHRGNVNRYFAENPDMVLGEQGFFDPLYLNRYAVRAPRDFDLEAALKRALGRLPEKIVSEPQDATDRANIDFGTSERKEGSFYLGRDGQLMQQRQGVGVPVQRRGKGVEGGRTAAEIERIEALIPVRDALRAVYAADLAEDSANAARARERLNKAYDAFVERFGPINKANFQYRRPTIIQQESARAEAREEARYAGTPWREGDFDPSEMIEAGASLSEIARARKAAREAAEKAGRPFDEGTFDPADMPDLVIEKRPNIDPFMDDPESYRLRAIEDYNDQTGEARKTDVFFKNVITREREPQISSAHDAVLYVLNKFGRLDLREVAAAAGISESQAIEELGDGIYRLPGTDNQWVTRDEYLSGNVRRKLRQARAAAQRDPALQRNVDALEAVQPDPLPPSEISANLGMPWIPTEVIERFGTEALGLDSLNVSYIPKLAQWSVSGDTDSVAARSTWGTDKRSAPALLSDALNRQDPRIYREIRTPDGTRRELDEVATEAAQDKVRALKERFADWIWSDPERAQSLADLYNEEYNNLRVREYDGSYLTTPGISAAWRWRPHQTRVIARIIQSGNTYMAHSVGAGKTSAMIGAGMEMRRLGLVRKPMYVVPNHMLGQFTKEFYEQYPTARIAVADERRFHTSRRKQFIADVANEDLDAIIITHSAFGMIPVSEQFQDNLIQEQIAEYRQLLEEVKSEGGDNRITRSRIEKQIERLEQRLSGRAQGRRDQVYTFEEMGVDFLFVDEAHLFRKLDFATKMSNVKGISPEGSKASWDLFVKSRWLETVNPGRNLVLASGTPVTNTMAELYSLSRYLQPQELRDRGIEHFDAWAGAYGDTVTQLEQNPAGGYQPVTRFAKFVNVPELSNMVRQVMDVVTSKQLEQYVTRPRLKGGKRQMNLAEKSEQLEAYQQHLAARMQAIAERKGPPKKGDDIILNVINDGRHAAIDMRLVNPDLPNDPGSKLNLLVDNVYRIWKQSKRQKFYQPGAEGYSAKPVDTGPATQMIFANLGLSSARGFSVPDYIRSELQRRGVPKDEIALIGDYKSHVAKQRLFNDMNEGKVRVLIGSTSKMATGVNAQRRLYALHNLDPLWYPADDEQRNGRILRQGNMNPEIEIHDYSTKGTYDSTMWGMMETKARFIQGFFEGDPNLRDMEDLGEASQYEQAKALTTADPRLIELTDLRQQLERARRRKAAHEREAYALKQRLSAARNDVAYWSARIPQIEADIAKRQDLRGDNFQARVDGKTYSERVEFGDLLLGRLEIMAGEQRDYSSHKIGEISGFDIIADVWGSGDNRRSALAIVREGNYEQEIKVSGSSRGLVQSIEAALRGFEADLANARQRLERAERTIRDAEGQGETSYSGDAEIERLTERVRALERELAPKKEEAAPGEGGEPIVLQEGDPLLAMSQFVSEEAEWQAMIGALDPVSLEGNERARRFVMERGRIDGYEHLVATNLETGQVVAVGTSQRASFVTLPSDLAAPLESPESEIVVHHNHPRNSPLSRGDISALGGGGLRLIFAHGIHGSLSAARLTPAVRAVLGRGGPKGRASISAIAQEAYVAVYDALLGPVMRGEIRARDADTFHLEVANRALARAGIIEYFSTIEPPGEQVFEQAVDTASRRAANAARQQFPQIQLLDGGRARSVRAHRDMALILGRDARPAEGRSGGTARDQAGRRNDRPEGSRSPELTPEQLFLLEEQGGFRGITVPRPRLSNTELAAVRGIIRRVSGLRDFEQADSIPIEAGPAAAAWGRPEGGGTAGGGYVPTRDAIILAMDSASPRAAYHESFHRLQNLFLTDREKAALAADHDRLRDLLKREGVRSAEQVDRMAGSEIEAEAFAAFATAKAEGQPVTGFPMRARMALAKIERVVRAVRNWLRGRGYQTWEDVFERAAAGEVARRLPRDAQGRFVSPSAITDTRMRYSVNEPIRPERNFPLRNPGRNAPTARNGAEARRRAMNQWLGMQPLDQAFRLPFHLFGGIDQRGEWNWGRYLNQQAERIITNAKFSDESRFAWINPVLQKARAGLLDRYGLDPAYIERERQRGLDERRILAQVPEIMQMLNDQNIGMEEAKVLHAVLTGEEVADAEMAKLAEPIRNAIDDMGAEAVRYGLLSPEAYERNRGAYLHRVYQKHENDMGGLTRWVSRSMASQRKKIIGEQFKGRGLWIEVPMSRLMRDMPGFREAQRGEVVKGERLRVLDRVEHTEQEELRGISSSARKRVLDRVYLPEGEAVPPRFADYADRGVWEVRGQKGGKVVLWRDFTREERRRMGEIVDARYTIAKTYMQMAHDLAVGKFYHDIAQNEDWSQAKEPADGKVVDALEFGRFDRVGRTDVEWVRVPDTKIANSQTKRYGALAGRYLRAEIWRDIQELERMQNPTFWNQALTQWKLNKTARNPVVHMNNVMSNLALMDLADVRSSDLVNAIASMVNRDDAFLEAQENGAFGSDMVAVEIRRNTLQPILERIQRESQGGRNTIESKLGLLGRLADGIWGFAKGLDRRMVELYQLEDEVFRMATYLRKRDLGFSPTEAALQARDQFLNYDIRAPWVNAARRSVLPFISYTYRAVPVVARSVMLRPWKLAKYATIAYAANALAYMVLGDEGDEDEERRSLRTEEQGSTWLGAPRMMRLPWNDDYGNPVFLDVRRWVPAGDIFDMNQGQSAIPVPAPLQFGGPLMLAGEFILNRQAFTGQEITNDLTDDWWDKSAKVTDWAWKSWMPSAPWIPGSWYWERIGNAMSGARDFRGRPYSVPQAVLSSAGIKVKPQDVRQGFYFHGLEFNRVEQELRAQMRRLARDRQRGLITERRFERERVRLITKMRRLGERRRQVFQGSD